MPVDKPGGITSFDVVWRVRKSSGIRKVGHCGTLDPAATGLLILLTGPATRLQDQFLTLNKEYQAQILLGVETDTWDLDGRELARSPVPELNCAEVEQVLRTQFWGEFEQAPPAYSAIKSEGIPNYKRARRGQLIPIKTRRVRVHEIEMTHFAPPEIGVRVACSSGFYVRSLAYDLGRQLGCGGTLKSLVRTKIGNHRLEEAWSLESLEQSLKAVRSNKSTCPI